jgi:uncharacterized protein YndB with AHSA1/START domain
LSETIFLTTLIPASPRRVYDALLSSEQHSEITGDAAQIEDRVGASFSAFSGYITGTNRELKQGRRIVQSWRTTEFSEESPDSLLDITLEADKESGGTDLTLVHDEIPTGLGEPLKEGWISYYFEPMKAYFAGRPEKKAAKKPAAKRAAKKPAAKKPAAKRTAAKPAAKKPAAKKPAAKRVAAKKPAAKKPVAKRAAKKR